MIKLEKLYSTIKNLEELGIDLPEDVIRQTEELEESLIKKEILPVVKESIEPVLSKIKRDLTLVVDYVPGVPVNVRLSRKPGIYKREDFIDLTPDPIVEHATGKSRKIETREPKTGLRVTLPNGKVIHEKVAAMTMVEAVKAAGPIKVRNLNIKWCKIPLVSTTKDKKYNSQQHDVGDGLFLLTHANNEARKRLLERISKELHLDWKVEVVK